MVGVSIGKEKYRQHLPTQWSSKDTHPARGPRRNLRLTLDLDLGWLTDAMPPVIDGRDGRPPCTTTQDQVLHLDSEGEPCGLPKAETHRRPAQRAASTPAVGA